MSQTNMLKPLLLWAVALAGCDEFGGEMPTADDVEEKAIDGDDVDAEAQDASQRRRAESRSSEDRRPDDTELDLKNDTREAEGPPGLTCCVDCGDNWAGWWDLGTFDECNARGAAFCHGAGWYFINAEWRPSC